MTDSARNASVRNGVAPDQPRPCAASLHARLCAMTSARGASESSPATGSGHSARTRRLVDRDDAASELDEPLDREGHVPVVHAHDDEVVRVVRHARGERAALEAGSGDEAETDAAGREMAFDDRDLREIAIGVGDGEPALDRRLLHERLGDHLILDEADRASAPSAPRDREIGGRERRDANRLPHPLRDLDARDVLDRPPALQHGRRLEAHEVGKEQQVGDVARSDRAVSREPVPERGMMRGHDDRVLGSDAGRDRLAHHAVHVPRVGDVLRVAIVGAEGDAPGAVLLDERQQRSADSEPSTPRGRGATSPLAGVRDLPRP